MNSENSVAVVGGGAAGLMAAAAVLRCGADAVIYERNALPGKKLRITGKGRCNVTNNCPPEEILKNVIRNPKFLVQRGVRVYPRRRHGVFPQDAGVPLKTLSAGRRVFPVSDKASDIVKALENTVLSGGGTFVHSR